MSMVISSTPVPATYIDVGKGLPWFKSQCLGGVALNDASQGLSMQSWHLEYDRETGDFVLTSDNGHSSVILTQPDVTSVSLAFDQNMQLFVGFVQNGNGCFYWYDPLLNDLVIDDTTVGSCTSLLVGLDDKRISQSPVSQVRVVYLRGTTIAYREQLDRYGTEYVLTTTARDLVYMGMSTGWRYQIEHRGGANPVSPFLAEIVSGELRKSGVRDEQINTDQLWFKVDGYRIASQGGADVKLEPLMAGYFFDPSVYDGIFHFPMRVNSIPVAELSTEELVARDNAPPVEITRVQEAELLRKVSLTYIDNTIDYVSSTQVAERRAGTITATGEQTSELPISLSPDEAATVSMRRLNVAWGEPQRYELTLPARMSAKVVPASTLRLRDRQGRVYIMRIMRISNDNGSLVCEAEDHAPWVYDIQAKGVQVAPGPSTTPGLVGDTVVIPMNLPVLNDGEDELGIYIAVYGTGSGWYGGEVQMSTDGGASVHQSFQATGAANVGELLEPLAAELDADYPGNQSLLVTMRYELESLSRSDMLRYNNLLAIQSESGDWELLQFTTATQVDDDQWLLEGVVRGRYNTKPAAAAEGARVVQIDGTIVFVQLQQWMLSQTLHYRGISYRQDSDEAEWEPFVAGHMESQTEWSVHRVRAERVGSDVTVSWIGRARLGVEINPYHSKYFAGYRVIYSDGYTADTTAMTHTRAGTPAGATVKIAPINSITGLGPESEGIPT